MQMSGGIVSTLAAGSVVLLCLLHTVSTYEAGGCRLSAQDGAAQTPGVTTQGCTFCVSSTNTLEFHIINDARVSGHGGAKLEIESVSQQYTLALALVSQVTVEWKIEVPRGVYIKTIVLVAPTDTSKSLKDHSGIGTIIYIRPPENVWSADQIIRLLRSDLRSGYDLTSYSTSAAPSGKWTLTLGSSPPCRATTTTMSTRRIWSSYAYPTIPPASSSGVITGSFTSVIIGGIIGVIILFALGLACWCLGQRRRKRVSRGRVIAANSSHATALPTVIIAGMSPPPAAATTPGHQMAPVSPPPFTPFDPPPPYNEVSFVSTYPQPSEQAQIEPTAPPL